MEDSTLEEYKRKKKEFKRCCLNGKDSSDEDEFSSPWGLTPPIDGKE
jgi:hypothetical protein